MALDRPLNALHLGNVHAHPNDQSPALQLTPSGVRLFRPSLSVAHSDYTVRVVASTKTVTARRSPRNSSACPGDKSIWTERNVQGIRILQVPALAKLPWLIHGFSTKPGGVSTQDTEKVLNLGFTEWDTKENVLENRRR